MKTHNIIVETVDTRNKRLLMKSSYVLSIYILKVFLRPCVHIEGYYSVSLVIHNLLEKINRQLMNYNEIQVCVGNLFKFSNVTQSNDSGNN